MNLKAQLGWLSEETGNLKGWPGGAGAASLQPQPSWWPRQETVISQLAVSRLPFPVLWVCCPRAPPLLPQRSESTWQLPQPWIQAWRLSSGLWKSSAPLHRPLPDALQGTERALPAIGKGRLSRARSRDGIVTMKSSHRAMCLKSPVTISNSQEARHALHPAGP